MPTKGVLMRLAQPQQATGNLTSSSLAPTDICPGIEAIYTFKADDQVTPEHGTFYFLSDIEPVIADESLYRQDVHKHVSDFTSLSWVLLSYVTGRDPDANPAESHTPATPPPVGTMLICNGGTPKPEWESDYHAWYDEEHAGKLTAVPGWQKMRRYELAKVYGETESAKLYGFNFYDEENGLGGPVWKTGVETEWTFRVREHAAKPNIRRKWKLVEAHTL